VSSFLSCVPDTLISCLRTSSTPPLFSRVLKDQSASLNLSPRLPVPFCPFLPKFSSRKYIFSLLVSRFYQMFFFVITSYPPVPCSDRSLFPLPVLSSYPPSALPTFFCWLGKPATRRLQESAALYGPSPLSFFFPLPIPHVLSLPFISFGLHPVLFICVAFRGVFHALPVQPFEPPPHFCLVFSQCPFRRGRRPLQYFPATKARPLSLFSFQPQSTSRPLDLP